MNIKDLKHLLTCSENETIEFKEAKHQFDKKELGKYVSALSNEANLKNIASGWLILGIKDDKTLVGTEFCRSLDEKNELKRYVSEQSNCYIQEIYDAIIDGKRILFFQIPAADKGTPTSWKGHYYGRDGSSLVALKLSKIENIRSQRKSLDWSQQIISDATLEDLDPEAIRLARTQFIRKNPKFSNEIDEWNDTTFLNKAKITIKGNITNTAILLLGKKESAHFISPATPQITWILKDKDNIEKDYEHFDCPLLINVNNVFKKIRNLKYRYMQGNDLFPEEVDRYDPYIIREALHNAIAHQDYTLGGKILVTEFEDDCLYFSNLGEFIPKNIEDIVQSNSPESIYRNPFLANAMVNLNMIDTIGSGIKRMFILQKNKYFPLPEYKLENKKVEVCIIGKVLDIAYAETLARSTELGLYDIILLDYIQKNKKITDEAATYLRKKHLIEGRKPNYYISSNIAKTNKQSSEYIHQKGFDDQYYKDLIIKYLSQFKTASRQDIDKLLFEKLPSILDDTKKYNKVKNLLQSLKKQKEICFLDGKWQRMSNH